MQKSTATAATNDDENLHLMHSDGSDGYDESESEEDEDNAETLGTGALARIDQALKTLESAQQRDDELEKQLIEDPDQYMGRIVEVQEEVEEHAEANSHEHDAAEAGVGEDVGMKPFFSSRYWDEIVLVPG